MLCVDVITPLPESWVMCSACETMLAQADLGLPPLVRDIDQYPADWQADWNRLAALLEELSAEHGARVCFRLIDPRSLTGMWKSLRFRVKVYPTFHFPDGGIVAGWDTHSLKSRLASQG